mgnify:CR=1 FL=1
MTAPLSTSFTTYTTGKPGQEIQLSDIYSSIESPGDIRTFFVTVKDESINGVGKDDLFKMFVEKGVPSVKEVSSRKRKIEKSSLEDPKVRGVYTRVKKEKAEEL